MEKSEKDKMLTIIRDLVDAYAQVAPTDSIYRKPYEHPLSAYDRAVEFLDSENNKKTQ